MERFVHTTYCLTWLIFLQNPKLGKHIKPSTASINGVSLSGGIAKLSVIQKHWLFVFTSTDGYLKPIQQHGSPALNQKPEWEPRTNGINGVFKRRQNSSWQHNTILYIFVSTVNFIFNRITYLHKHQSIQ